MSVIGQALYMSRMWQ